MTLVAAHLYKHFGPTRAASDVSITLRTGTVHAIVGENGAGKSTTLRMLGGAMRPDSGEMTLRDAPYAPQSIVDATLRGVALVHQEITITRKNGSFTLEESLADLVKQGLVDRKDAAARAPHPDELERALGV